MAKNLVFGSMGVAALVALLAILDIALKVPFGGANIVFNILFIVASAVVCYLGWETWQEGR
jgi:hypothetical protein